MAACPAPTASAASSAVVEGAIGARYSSLGGPGSFLGQPRTPEVPTPTRPGAYVVFDAGSIYWSPATGAWDVHGAIRDEWQRTGWEAGPLGFPTSGEVRTPNGRGAYTVFERGSIYWSPTTGAHEVHGDIRAAYAWAGWENGYLGFPRTGEVPTPAGDGAYTVFEGGSIYWSPWVGGAHVLRGAIRDAWASIGWENSPLGYPTSSEFNIRGGKRANFERGFIEWSPATGARINRTLADPSISGCDFPRGPVTIEHAADCVIRAWDAERFDIMREYATNAATIEASQWGGPFEGRRTFEGCEHNVPYPITQTSTGIECTYYFDDPAWIHGYAIVLGIEDYGYGPIVSDVESIG
nr:hypothetical protein [Kineococcus aurantiacus]